LLLDKTSALSPEATLTGTTRRQSMVLELGQGDNLIIEIEGEAPAWLSGVIRQLPPLANLSTNWNSYGAVPVSRKSIIAALVVLFSVMQEDTPIPDLVPTPRGTIQLEWHTRGIDLEVDVLPGGLFHISYEDLRGDALVEDLTTLSLGVVNQALTELSTRG